MIPIEMRLKGERRLRQILREENAAQPDIVQYGENCVRFYWTGRETSIVVEIDENGEVGPSRLAGPPAGEEGSQPPV